MTSIVVPGTPVGKKGEVIEEFVYEEDGIMYSKVVGLREVKNFKVKITPLSGIYIPKKDDLVIGRIIEVYPNGWQVDINSPYLAFMLLKDGVNEFVDITKVDLNTYYTYNDYIVARISNVTRNKLVNVVAKGSKELGKIRGGLIISVNPKKVPRIIGKGGSMVKLIREKTGVSIVVGQNGRVWIKTNDPEKQLVIVEAIRLIERNSHVKGLTDKVSRFLDKHSKELNKDSLE